MPQPEPGHRSHGAVDALGIVLVTIAFGAAVASVNPSGDFPLNDDWSYARTAMRLASEGIFRPLGWTQMPLVSNALWGALFCLPGPCSHEVLRYSTIVLAWLGGVALWGILGELRVPTWLALLGVLTFLFNPLQFALAHTFMTDVGATTFMLWSAFFLVRYLRTGGAGDLVAAAALAGVAVLSRQVALVPAVAFVPVAIVRQGLRRRALARAVVPVLVAAGVLVAFEGWLDARGARPTMYGQKVAGLLGVLGEAGPGLVGVLRNAFVALCYCGLFLLPVLVPGTGAMLVRSRRARVMAVVALLLVAGTYLAWLLRDGRPPVMPWLENMLGPAGIGPMTLRDVYVLRQDLPYALPRAFWVAVTVLGLGGGALLVTRLLWQGHWIVRQAGRGTVDAVVSGSAFGLLVAGLMLGAFVLTTPLFDRYLVVVLPLLMVGLVAGQREAYLATRTPARVIAAGLVAAGAVFAVAGTHDWLSWNRARWRALDDLVTRLGIEPRQIDGGFEFNGLHSPGEPPDEPQSSHGKSWWWVEDDEYVVAFTPIPGYEVIGRHPYRLWLAGREPSILVLRRSAH